MSQLLQNLNIEQLQAVTHGEGPLLIVAGAGTGKTTVITRRIAYLIEQKLAKPDEILSVTFTKASATEMEERVDELVPLGTFDLWISTFHGFCEEILNQHGLDIGHSNNFELLDDTAQWILIYKNFDAFNLDYYRPLGNPNKFIDALIRHFSKCKDEMITPAEYIEYAQKLKLDFDSPDLFTPIDAKGSATGFETSDDDKTVEAKRIEEIAGAYHTYQKLLLDNEYLDFGDLINYTIELFKRRPNVLKYYQNKFKYVMVDEFQDTNFAQYQLIKMISQISMVRPLPNPPLARGGNKTNKISQVKSNLVVVGDDDQSIYKFRGASVSNILKLKEDFPDVKQITLTQNYRSSQEILDLAYNFIQANNPNRLESKLGIDKRLKTNTEEKGVVEVLEAGDLSAELNMVVNTIATLKQDNPDATWNDFAILIRANSAADEILPKLDSAGITYTFWANTGLFRKRLISDLIAYMRLLDNHHESSSLYRIINFPKFQMDPNDVALITNFANKKTLSLYEVLLQIRTIPTIGETSIQIAEVLTSTMRSHAAMMRQKTAVEVFVAIVKDLGLLDDLEPDTIENAENREYLDQFYKKIEDFEQGQEDTSLKNFMYHLALELRAGNEGLIKFDPNRGPESLKVMTIHSSKGLEFKYVFIINMVDQRFPTRAKHDGIEIPEALIKDILPEGDFHLQEERRLFYVAMTRAKTNLYLSWSKDYGGAKFKKPSIFLQETNLISSDKISFATGKVAFSTPVHAKGEVVYHNIPTTFSFSEIMVFENCPLEYKFRWYLRLPMAGTPNLSFGKTIHAVLEEYAKRYKQGQTTKQQALFGDSGEIKTPDFSLMEALYQELWIDEWYHTKKEKEEFKKLGMQLLKTVHENFEKVKPNLKYIEQAFHLPLGDYQFKGKIDRADSLDEGIAIIDYKTGSKPKAKNKKDLDQLRIYQWATEEHLGEQVRSLQYWYLKDDQLVDQPIATEEEIQALKASLLETIEEIRETIAYDLFEQRHKKSKQHTCNFEDYV